MSKILSSLSFLYDSRGFGDLILSNGVTTADRYVCRTGSIDKSGKLINSMPIGNYAIKNITVSTPEEGMWIDTPENGWKAILWLVNDYGEMQATKLRIHPDGGLGGTLGCIGIQGTNAPALRKEIDAIIEEQEILAVTVGLKTIGAGA
jgi:hypothetical protein